MSDIVDRLNTLSDIIMMGEKIAWEIDSAIMRDAAAEIEKLRVKIAKAEKKAERDYLRFVDADREEITRLREENARLREALKPFAGVFLFPDDLGFEHSEDIRSDPDWDDDANDMQSEDVFVLRRDVRRARAAIREGGGKDD